MIFCIFDSQGRLLHWFLVAALLILSGTAYTPHKPHVKSCKEHELLFSGIITVDELQIGSPQITSSNSAASD